MLRSLYILALVLLACGKDSPAPTAPAGKGVATEAAPAAPQHLRVEALTDTSALVAWDGVEGATDYDVNYKAVGGKWTNRPHRGASQIHTTIWGLTPDTQYRWAVRAENRDGPSAWVFGDNFTTLADTVATTPADQFDIDLVFLDHFSDTKLTARQRALVRKAADRWEEVIVGDVEDVFHDGNAGWHTYRVRNYRDGKAYADSIRITGHIDDVRIYVRVRDNVNNAFIAAVGIELTRRISWDDASSEFTSSGLVELYDNHIPPDDATFFVVALHEIGHILGISHKGFLRSGYFRPLDIAGMSSHTDETHFVGPSAVKHFDLMGGRQYRGDKVPMRGFSHWNANPLRNDIMASRINLGAGISLVTVGALSDLGYEVNFGAADDVELEWDHGSGKATIHHHHPHYVRVAPPQ